jgi:hypothetical protein
MFYCAKSFNQPLDQWVIRKGLKHLMTLDGTYSMTCAEPDWEPSDEKLKNLSDACKYRTDALVAESKIKLKAKQAAVKKETQAQAQTQAQLGSGDGVGDFDIFATTGGAMGSPGRNQGGEGLGGLDSSMFATISSGQRKRMFKDNQGYKDCLCVQLQLLKLDPSSAKIPAPDGSLPLHLALFYGLGGTDFPSRRLSSLMRFQYLAPKIEKTPLGGNPGNEKV